MKKVLYTTAGLILAGISNVNAAINTGTEKVDGNIRSEGDLVSTVQGWVGNALSIISVLAVLYGIWGGFNILTAAGDDEKVSKGKTIIINSLLGIAVIFVVGLLVDFLIGIILT